MNEKDLLHDDDHLDLITLGEMLTGERPVSDPEALAAYRAEVEAVWKAQPAFDFEVLRAASHRVEDTPAAAPGRTRRPWWRWAWLPALALAAVLVVVAPPPGPSIRTKDVSAELSYFLKRGDTVMPAPDNVALRAGDRIQFTYRAARNDTLVLVGVDGAGTVSLYYPSRETEPPIAVEPTGSSVLDGALELDATPGTETFVAVFGARSTAAAQRRVRKAYEEGGHAALAALAADDPSVAIVAVRKR